jgi:hypothetical protein
MQIRNALMPFELPQAASVQAFTNPLMQGMQSYRQGMQQQFEGERALERERLAQKADSRADEDQAMQREQRLVQRMGALAQVVADDPDPTTAAANWAKLHSSMPQLKDRLVQYGVDPNNYKAGAAFLSAEAGKYMSPMDRRLKSAEVAGAEGKVGMLPLQRQAAELDLKIKQREFDTPKDNLQKLGKDDVLVRVNPRAGGGAEQVWSNPGNAQIGPYKDMKQKADVEEGLRKEVSAAAKDYGTIKEAATSLEAISKAPSAASDIAMVFSFMKILDPGSVVRETEYATAARAAGVPERVVGVIERIQSGQFLTPSQRQDFLGVAKTLAQSREQGYRQNLERYRGISERISVDPRNVLPDDGPPAKVQPPPQSAPQGAPQQPQIQPGGVYNYQGRAWRYKGGDKAAPDSWEPVQ